MILIVPAITLTIRSFVKIPLKTALLVVDANGRRITGYYGDTMASGVNLLKEMKEMKRMTNIAICEQNPGYMGRMIDGRRVAVRTRDKAWQP